MIIIGRQRQLADVQHERLHDTRVQETVALSVRQPAVRGELLGDQLGLVAFVAQLAIVVVVVVAVVAIEHLCGHLLERLEPLHRVPLGLVERGQVECGRVTVEAPLRRDSDRWRWWWRR